MQNQGAFGQVRGYAGEVCTLYVEKLVATDATRDVRIKPVQDRPVTTIGTTRWYAQGAEDGSHPGDQVP